MLSKFFLSYLKHKMSYIYVKNHHIHVGLVTHSSTAIFLIFIIF